MKKTIYLLAGILFMFSCRETTDDFEDKNLVFLNNFENTLGWGGITENPSITKEQAHSGKYSVKIDKNIEFGLGFSQIIGKMFTARPKKVKLEAWAYIPNGNADGILVFSIVNPTTNQTILWEGIKLKEVVKSYNEWTQISKEIDFPANAQITDNMSTYLWRPSGVEPAYIDDIKLTIIE